MAHLEKGGWAVMGPLAVATLILWYCIGLRAFTLRRGSLKDVRFLIEAYTTGKYTRPRGVVDKAVAMAIALAAAKPANLRRVLDDGFADLEKEIEQGRILIKSIVSAAPLAGLLGTVTGMIETFDSLADMSLYSSSGGIAGGISQALFTTQMGLSVAVPGVIAGLLLERKQRTLAHEMEIIKDTFCHKAAAITPQAA